jgi:hypothetical protein
MFFHHHDCSVDDNPEVDGADGEQIRRYVVGMKHDERKQQGERDGDGNDDGGAEADQKKDQHDEHQGNSSPCPRWSFDKFPMPPAGPRIICEAKPNPVRSGGMIIEQENIHAVRIGIR